MANNDTEAMGFKMRQLSETPSSKSVVRFSPSVRTSVDDKSSCKDCGGVCGETIYRQFAEKYTNKPPRAEVSEMEKDGLDFEQAQMLEEKEETPNDDDEQNEENLVTEKLLIAKHRYLKYHHPYSKHGDENTDDDDLLHPDDTEGDPHCKYMDTKCYALEKSRRSHDEILNNLSELELVHLVFYHIKEFNNHWFRVNRGRTERYSHEQSEPTAVSPTLNNDLLNDDKPPTQIRERAENKLRQLSVDWQADMHKQQSMDVPDFTFPRSGSSLRSVPSMRFSASTTRSSSGGPVGRRLQWTKSVGYQKLLVDQHKKKKASTDVLLFGFEFPETGIAAKWKNPKEEVLKNELLDTPIKVSEWNNLLRGCARYLKTRTAKKMGLAMKEIVALKLYTDFDELQRKYRRCFRIQDEQQRQQTQKHFVHWNALLICACKKAIDDVKEDLYHGVSDLDKTSAFTGKYWGPVSTTTILDVATQFSGDNGTVLQLHTLYNMKGIRLSWLSNYPDEDEVLYMNVTFEISDIIDPQSGNSKLVPVAALESLKKSWSMNKTKTQEELRLFEETIKHSLQRISVNSKVISLNQDSKTGLLAGLPDDTKVSILKLLYLQYKPDRWDTMCEEDGDVAAILSSLRDQFIELVGRVKAIQMHDISPLIQDFFCANQRHYDLPFTGDPKTYEDEMKEFHAVFHASSKPRYINLQTVIRLFPEAEQISINANNFDFSLDSFVKFLEKWRYDYTAMPINFIDIKFVKTNTASEGQQNHDDEKDAAQNLQNIDLTSPKRAQTEEIEDAFFKDGEHDVRAIEELEKCGAESNISKLLKLGWKFLSPSRLSRVPFDPEPELPFLPTFTKGVVFYRRYTQKLLARVSSHRSTEGWYGDDDEEPLSLEGSDLKMDELEPGSSQVTVTEDEETEVSSNPKRCVLSTEIWDKIQYKDDLKKLLNKVKLGLLITPKGPGATDQEAAVLHAFIRACGAVRTLSLEPMPRDLVNIFCAVEDDEDDDECKVVTEKQHTYHLNVNDALPKPEKPKTKANGSAATVSISAPTAKKKYIAYHVIDEIFPHVQDIFLRETEFNLKECRRLTNFLKAMRDQEKLPFERIFYKVTDEKTSMDKHTKKNLIAKLKRAPSMYTFKEEQEDDEDEDFDDFENGVQVAEIQKIVKMLDTVHWCFQDNGQIVFRKDLYHHHDRHQNKWHFVDQTYVAAKV